MSEPVVEPPVIELSNGAVAIAGRPILRHIDLTVRSGEFVALMGANGSGKSTLVRALTGLLPLTTGSLQLFGTPFDKFHAWQRIGFGGPAYPDGYAWIGLKEASARRARAAGWDRL